MAWHRHRTTHCNSPLAPKTCVARIVQHHHLYLPSIRKSKRMIGVMKYIRMCTSLHFFIEVSLSLLFYCHRPTSANSSGAALSFWTLRFVFSAMYRIPNRLVDPRSWSVEMQRSIRRSNCSWPACYMCIMLIDWAKSQMPSLTLLSIGCVVKLH
jgi:hypothetical protein